MKVNLTLNVVPKPLPRARHAPRGKFSSSYYPKNIKERFTLYENEIARAFGELSKEQRLYIIDVVKGLKSVAIRMDAVFYMPIPKSVSNKKREALLGTQHVKKPDRSNILKLIEDRAEGILYKNDSCVYDGNIKKIYGNVPRIELELEYEELS